MRKGGSYKEQDKKRIKKESVKVSEIKNKLAENVTVDNLQVIINQAEEQNYRWKYCNNKLTNVTPPPFDRKLNSRCDTLENIQLSCCECNCIRSNHNGNISRVKIQIRNFALQNNLPMTLTNKETIQHLEEAEYGGLSNVMHRINIAGETKINKLKYNIKNNKIESNVREKETIHILGINFNGLYPSGKSVIKNELTKYTNKIIRMPGRFNRSICVYEGDGDEIKKIKN
jgi:hypothetical protein